MRRRQDIELLRILSAFGIVWFHTQPFGGAVAYGGLVAFLVLSVYMSGTTTGPGTAAMRRRARRLLLPWLVWGLVYGGVNLLRGDAFLPTQHGVVSGVLAGPSIHLWYLPFMFLTLTLVDMLRARLSPRTLSYAAGVLAVTLVAMAPIWRPLSLGWPYPWLQWADAAGPVAAGLFLSHAAALPKAHRIAIGALLLTGAVAVATRNSIGISFAVGLTACLLIATGRTRDLITVDLGLLSGATFGIYLVHSLVFLAFLTQSPMSTRMPGALMPFAVFGVAAVAVMAARSMFSAKKEVP